MTKSIKYIVIGLLAIGLSFSFVELIKRWRRDAILTQIDMNSGRSYHSYSTGNVALASNALSVEIKYLADNSEFASRFLRVDLVQRTAAGRLAYLLDSIGETQGAVLCLEEAYRAHRLMQERGGADNVSREGFADYLWGIMQELDERSGALWKEALVLSSSPSDDLKSRFTDLHTVRSEKVDERTGQP